MKTVRMALDILSRGERRRGALILALICVMALMEMVGVASVLPLLSVVGNPESIQERNWLLSLYEFTGAETTESFLTYLTAGTISLTVFVAIFRVFTTYVMNRYIQMRRHSISERLLSVYVRSPYTSFLNRHTSDMAKNILSETDQVVQQILSPFVELCAQAALVFAILALLMVYDPLLTVSAAFFIFSAYAGVYLVFKRLLQQLGHRRLSANRDRFAAASDALSGIKDIKLLGREAAYLSRFRPASVLFARNQATKATIGVAPKYVFEAAAICGILIIMYLQMRAGMDFADALPALGLFAFGGLKLLPASQRIYQSVANLRFGNAIIDNIHRELNAPIELISIKDQDIRPVIPQHEIVLENLSFRYPGADGKSLHAINVSIPVGSSLGIVGSTGAGKTTLVDLILGLLTPTEGKLKVDGRSISGGDIRAWQRSLGYVPQTIFLSDASIAENIALGIPTDEIDLAAVKRAALIAQLHDFIMNELPQGYDTRIGERGVRLSGGQRQRIGIARALYHDPAVVVFDEATSALDNATEKAVMDSLAALARVKTLIVVAHRLNTVRFCNLIAVMETGRVVGLGSFDELERDNEAFRRISMFK